MEHALIYGAYGAAALVALAVFFALPKADRPRQRGLAVLLAALSLGGLVMLLGRLLGDSSGRLYFYLFSLLAVVGAVRVITHRRPVYSALYFVMVVLSTAGLMVLAGAEFLAAALVIVYAGAILVTYVFVIMMAHPSPPTGDSRLDRADDYDRRAREPGAAVFAGFVLIATVAGVIVGRSGPAHTAGTAVPQEVAGMAVTQEVAGMAVTQEVAGTVALDSAAPADPAVGNTLSLGRVLLTDFAVSVELAGVLLMVAMIGAIAIARRRLPRVDEDVTGPAPGEIGKHVEPF